MQPPRCLTDEQETTFYCWSQPIDVHPVHLWLYNSLKREVIFHFKTLDTEVDVFYYFPWTLKFGK